MSGAKGELAFEEAYPRAGADRRETFGLGLVVLIGMVSVEQMEKFAGTGLDNTYRTHFPMANGDQWEIEIRRKLA